VALFSSLARTVGDSPAPLAGYDRQRKQDGWKVSIMTVSEKNLEISLEQDTSILQAPGRSM
jgi:hypothetical protein